MKKIQQHRFERAPWLVDDLQGFRSHLDDMPAILDLRQVYQPNPVRKTARLGGSAAASNFHCQTRLTAATWPNKGQQALGHQQAPDFCQLRLPADESGKGRQQIVRSDSSNSKNVYLII
jgi:hypothetical protein